MELPQRSRTCHMSAFLKQSREYDTYSPVLHSKGQTELTRMFLSPYSAARPLVAFATAALLALYQTRPGLGRVAPIEAMLIMEPPSPWLMSVGMKCLDDCASLALILLIFSSKSTHMEDAPNIDTENLVKLILNNLQTRLNPVHQHSFPHSSPPAHYIISSGK